MQTQTKVCATLLAALSLSATWFVYTHGYTLYYGDAEAHLNIARRWIDSRTPGPEQLGTAWLPLPHLLMTPFVYSDKLWRNGLAGAIPSSICFVIAGLFLFASARKVFKATAAWAALAVFALNPNILYLQAIPMTESMMAAALMALLWSTLRYRETPLRKYVLAAAASSIAASLTRYEGWFLIPFVAVFFAKRPLPNGRGSETPAEPHPPTEPRPLGSGHALVFAALAALGPLSWLAHNQFYWNDALAFYHGPYSAMAIYQRQLAQGLARYPGDHNWLQAIHYYFAAVRSVVGWPVMVLATAGIVFSKNNLRWPLFFLALSPLFYVMSMHSSGTPIYVPDLWPFSWYNTRYGLAALPFIAFSVAALVQRLARRASPPPTQPSTVGGGLRLPNVLMGTVIAAIIIFSFYERAPITWKESQVNSIARRAWTSQSATYLKEHVEPDATLIYFFGDLTGVLRQSGMQLRQGLHQDNGVAWNSAVQRPNLFLHEEWALAVDGDPVSLALRTARDYDLVQRVTVPGAPAIEIYRRRPLDTHP